MYLTKALHTTNYFGRNGLFHKVGGNVCLEEANSRSGSGMSTSSHLLLRRDEFTSDRSKTQF